MAKKCTFFKRVSPWILSKNKTFFYRCFSQKLSQKRSFLDILNRKQSFWDQEMEVLTRAKKFTFLKGVSPWILSKNGTFSHRLFSQKSYKKTSFFYIVESKDYFKSKKIEVLKRARKWTFFKGVSPRFCPKIEISRMGVSYRNYVRKNRFWIF